tara:strand:- start:412 stop:942 length:531 start_codon:yes stop_codon:yes gene_type:complete
MNIVLFGITGFGNCVMEQMIDLNLAPKKIVTRYEKNSDPYTNQKHIYSLAEEKNIPVEYDVSCVKGSYDLCIVATYHKFINLEKMNLKYAYNIHPSLLPKYKGKDPINEVIKKKEKISGVTVHKLTNKFDEGEIFFQEKILIGNFDKGAIMKQMFPIYKSLTKKLLNLHLKKDFEK